MAESQSNERWRQVVGYEGFYSVSDQGRVRRDASYGATWKGRILKLGHSNGYLMVIFTRPGYPRKRQSVHRLVLTAFAGDPPEGHQANHKNGNKHDNRLENLEWCSASDNQKHSFRVLGTKATGPINPRYGEDSHTSRFKNEDIRNIRALHSEGMSANAIAKRYKTSHSHVIRIVNRVSWKHLS